MSQQQPLAIEDHAHNEDQGTTTLEVNGMAVKLDALGPVLVNSDGTLSRVANWADMNELERERTVRILVKRNKVRMTKLAASVDGEKVSALQEADGASEKTA
ncbi:uncharacterized protein EHS24_001324 [Apiotrichum porosum]|uniref:Uncharacterized protein n=1 Tax=Apiotrichum porosum TaxID=105984 RepID=A0A427XKI7_9TREE|nr:uncharacterized protein EHS24_001324 [Apiotrichum porosum]RSH79284.1 hypothetical protein EHS24_001324 [Apiotrichum porosum]